MSPGNQTHFTTDFSMNQKGTYSQYNVTTLLLTYHRYVELRIPSGWCLV
jgi:hypothetical protein